MRISTKGRYSLEAMLYMVLLPHGEYASTRAIAESTGISDGYLEQLFIPMRKAGLVQGIRGPQGGYLPGKPPAKIRVGDILRAVEGPMELAGCVQTACPREENCASRHTWGELYREIRDCIDSITLADLADAYHKMDTMEYTI